MGRKKIRKPKYQKTELKVVAHDPLLMEAVSLANFQFNVRKQAVRALTVDQEVQKHTKKQKLEVEDEYTDWLYGCFALVLHRQYGWGNRRILRIFDAIQELKNDLVADGIDHQMIWDIVREEIKLDIVTEGGAEE